VFCLLCVSTSNVLYLFYGCLCRRAHRLTVLILFVVVLVYEALWEGVSRDSDYNTKRLVFSANAYATILIKLLSFYAVIDVLIAFFYFTALVKLCIIFCFSYRMLVLDLGLRYYRFEIVQCQQILAQSLRVKY